MGQIAGAADKFSSHNRCRGVSLQSFVGVGLVLYGCRRLRWGRDPVRSRRSAWVSRLVANASFPSVIRGGFEVLGVVDYAESLV
jgi:hypothetical protein